MQRVTESIKFPQHYSFSREESSTVLQQSWKSVIFIELYDVRDAENTDGIQS